MPLIHLIRHGETDGNRNHYVGRKDLWLNTKGQSQAISLAETLAAFPIARIISSPLQRALQTAQPLARRLRLTIEPNPALIEFDFGQLQDLPKADYALDLRKQHGLVRVPGGECLQDVWKRLQPLRSDLLARPVDGDVALVGHYWSNRMLFGLLSGMPFEQALGVCSYKPDTGTSFAIHWPEG
ncbi:MAG: histidine phosphatase family protein [Rhodobacteraceae bacterium]|jgi:probable phosphoglycerate mutase|nr:histidine phosphatase family protein [Paracoccaceae bacterium]